jgi:uncharacterized glyoxalase superfamily protein PhnB
VTDPLDALLNTPAEPVHPDPIFTERLRARLRAAVLNPLGETMTETAEVQHESLTWPPSLTPYITVADGRAAMAWYAEVFGARRRGEPYVMPDGAIGHAELALGDAVLMLSEGSEEVPVQPPPARPSSHSHTLHLQVPDVDATVATARANGASVEREPGDNPYGRVAVVVDPFGHRWMLNTPPGSATRHAPGDVSYVTMVVADAEAAKSFYATVFGWQWQPGGVPGGWHPVGREASFGLWGDRAQRPEVQLCYRVHDIEAAAARVRAAGGEAGEVERASYGLIVNCTDNQGATFQLWEPVD